MSKNEIVGTINEKVIDMFDLNIKTGQPIYLGQGNKEHMQAEHPDDYSKYGDKIEYILNNPDFIAKHPKKDSIEFIKIFPNGNDDYVLVAVRATGKGQFFARTLFVMDKEKVDKYTEKDAFKPYK